MVEIATLILALEVESLFSLKIIANVYLDLQG